MLQNQSRINLSSKLQREIHKWYSNNLNKEMDIAVYGHYGYALLMFPTAANDFLEYEKFQLIDSISGFINDGKLKAYCVNSINGESWLNYKMYPQDKAVRHLQYNHYIVYEVIPFIIDDCKGKIPIITCGASLGAYHAANMFFRNPELFSGFIAMSGSYDLKAYAHKYFDDNIYFNSPVDYLPNLNDKKILKKMYNKNIIIASGRGENEDASTSEQLSEILQSKNIQHWLDLWGDDMVHDWPTWKKMLPYFLSKISPWEI